VGRTSRAGELEASTGAEGVAAEKENDDPPDEGSRRRRAALLPEEGPTVGEEFF